MAVHGRHRTALVGQHHCLDGLAVHGGQQFTGGFAGEAPGGAQRLLDALGSPEVELLLPGRELAQLTGGREQAGLEGGRAEIE